MCVTWIWCVLVTCFSAFISAQDASKTLLWGEALTKIHAGAVSSFYIQTRNSEGNNVTSQAADISVLCVSDPDAPFDFCKEDPVVTELGTGLFSVSFIVGRFWAEDRNPLIDKLSYQPLPDDFFSHTNDRLHVKVNEEHVPGSPFFPLFVGSPEVDETKSQISSSTLTIVAGLSTGIAEFHRIKDVYGNNVRPSSFLGNIDSHLILMEASIGSSENGNEATVTSAWVLTNWYVNFVAACYTAGVYKFQVWISQNNNNEPTKYFPIKSDINGLVDQSWYLICIPKSIHSITFGLPSQVVVGKVLEITAQAQDQYGNAAYFKSNPDDLFEHTLEDQSVDGITVSVLHGSCDCSMIQSLEIKLDDQVPGKLKISFLTNISGVHKFQFFLDDNEFTDGPLLLDAKPQLPDLGRSTVSLKDKSSGSEISTYAGEELTFEIKLYDEYGNPTEGDKSELAARLINVENPETDLLNPDVFTKASAELGNYQFIANSTKAGLYVLSVTYRGLQISDNLPSVFVNPAVEVDPAKCQVVGSGIGIEIGQEKYYSAKDYQQSAGQNLSLIITAVDPYGNPQTSSQPGFTLNDQFQSSTIWFQQIENGDGKTRIYFAIEETGKYYLRISYHATKVYESYLEIEPAGILHTNCKAFNFDTITAGNSAVAYLQVKDSYGNLFNNINQTFLNFTQFYIGFYQGDVENPSQIIYLKVGDYNEDKEAFRMEYNLTNSGMYSISARWESWPIQGHGASLIVKPDITNAHNSLMLDLESEIKAGTVLEIKVVAQDQYNNTATEDHKLLALTSFVLRGAVDKFDKQSPFDLRLLQPGIVVGSIRLTISGIYTIQAFISEEPVSPVNGRNVTVLSGTYNSSMSTVEFVQTVKIEAWNEVVVFPRDEFGNLINSEVFIQNLELRVSGFNTVITYPFQLSDIYGQLRTQYRVNSTGSYQLAILLNNEVIDVSLNNITSKSNENNGEHSSEFLKLNDSVLLILMVAGCVVLLAMGYWFLIKEHRKDDAEFDLEIHEDCGIQCAQDTAIETKKFSESDMKAEEDRIRAYRTPMY